MLYKAKTVPQTLFFNLQKKKKKPLDFNQIRFCA